MVKRIIQTRFKLAGCLIVLGLIEALLKAFIPSFPLTELFAFQGLAGGWYMGMKTTNNVKDKQYENNS